MGEGFLLVLSLSSVGDSLFMSSIFAILFLPTDHQLRLSCRQYGIVYAAGDATVSRNIVEGDGGIGDGGKIL